MNLDELEIVNRELLPGEKLVWAGRPRQGVYLRSTDAAMIPFSIMWGGFAIFWEYSVIEEGAPLLFKLWGIPFVVIGLYLMIGRFFYRAWIRRKTVYGLTNERVLIVTGRRGLQVYSHRLDQLPNIHLVEHQNGTGSIDLTPDASQKYSRRGDWGRKFNDAHDSCLESISEPRTVYNQILEVQRTLRRTKNKDGG